jgi:hypothetical protein
MSHGPIEVSEHLRNIDRGSSAPAATSESCA